MTSKSCCSPRTTENVNNECTIVKECILHTDEGDFDCECICKCERDSSTSCKDCACDCKCTPETAEKVITAEGTKYQCQCTCKC